MDVSMREHEQATGTVTGGRWTVPVERNGRVLELECRESLDDLEALKEEWQSLERRCPETFTYFQSFDWCRTWSRTFLSEEESARARPKIYVLWDGAECIMIWPLMTRRIGASLTVLMPLTAPMNQYATVLYDPGAFDVALGRAVFEKIRNRGGRDAICVDHVPQSALLARIIEGQGRSSAVPQQSSIFDLSGFPDWESHHRSLPKKQRLQRNSRRNRLEKLGVVEYRILVPGSEGYAENIERCLAMKQDWLKGTGRRGRNVFDPRFTAFLHGLGEGAGEDEGRVFLHALTLDGVPIAMELGMRFRQHYYCFLGAIDLTYQKHSPGKVQMENAQRWAIETGIRRFDFLNDPSTYKSSWTNTAEPLAASYIPFTSLGYLYCRHWKAGLRPRLRALYDGIGPAWRNRVRVTIDALQQFFGRNGSTVSLMLCCVP